MRNSTFFPFGLPPISNLEKRVAIQRRALAQAEADLAEARGERGIAEASEELAAEPSIYHSNEHRRMHAAAERRRRGLGAEPGPAVLPTVPTTAAEIIAADRKARGLAPLSEVDPDPNFMPATGLALRRRHDPDTGDVEVYFAPAQAPQTTSPKTTAEFIIEAHRKANGGK
jgi:hypothetical protein